MGPASSAGSASAITVEVVRSIASGLLLHCRLTLPEGSTAGDAAQAALAHWGRTRLAGGSTPSPAAAEGDGAQVPDAANRSEGAVDPAEWLLAVWGRRCAPGKVLRSGDRLEWLRPLVVDPKEARRLRYRRTAGRQGGIERGRAARLRAAGTSGEGAEEAAGVAASGGARPPGA